VNQETEQSDARAGLHGRYRTWARPAVVVDFCYGVTDPESPLGAHLTPQVTATRELLETAWAAGAPAIFLTTGYSAGFADTPLGSLLTSRGASTVFITGATTSGCVRAIAVDAVQTGFRAAIRRECVGDRAVGPYKASLLDLHAKYADVVSLAEAIPALAREWP